MGKVKQKTLNRKRKQLDKLMDRMELNSERAMKARKEATERRYERIARKLNRQWDEKLTELAQLRRKYESQQAKKG